MNRYTIHCTEAQTRKALALGAPILSYRNAFASDLVPHFSEKSASGDGHTLYICPTAEQMFGWLSEKGLSVEVYEQLWYFQFSVYTKLHTSDGDLYWHEISFEQEHPTRTEATLAAIDSALAHLSTLA